MENALTNENTNEETQNNSTTVTKEHTNTKTKNNSNSKSKTKTLSLSSRKHSIKFIDISYKKEKLPILFPSKFRIKLSSLKFDYKLNYITKSFIKNGDIDEYQLTKEYSCECIRSCNKSTCKCVLDHIQRYECNINCACKFEECENRVIQRGITKKLKVTFINKTKGFGVFAFENIKQDDFICEYVGQIINKDIAKDKIRSNMIRRKPNYVLQIRENYENMTVNTFIDAEEFGNVSRWFNHSCDPNLYFDIARINHFIPQVGFFAKRDIKEGEELTFSYCDISSNSGEEHFESYKICECGGENCRKYLPS
jgi:SET domain-containing protein